MASKKLNKKTLDELIVEVLQERYTIDLGKGNKDISGSNPSTRRKISTHRDFNNDLFAALRDESDPEDTLNFDDIVNAASTDGSDSYKAVEKIITSPGGFVDGPAVETKFTAAIRDYANLLSRHNLNTNSKKSALGPAIVRAAYDNNLSDAKKLLRAMRKLYSKTPADNTDYGRAQQAINYMSKTKNSDAGYEKALKQLEQALGALSGDDMPVTRPTMYSASTAEGKFAPELISSFDRVFNFGPKAANLVDRVKRISEISVAMVSEQTDAVMDLPFINSIADLNTKKRAILSCVMVLDYIAAFAKYFDHGSGGYLFETFCALISGGKVTGKGMGSGDFEITTENGAKLNGSSKYYLKGAAMSQSLKGFTNNDPVNYIVAQKNKSDPEELNQIGIHLGEVTIVNSQVTAHKGNLKFSIGDSKLEIEAVGQPTATVMLAKAGGTDFKQSLQNTMNVQDDTVKAAFNLFKEFIQQTLQADQFTKKYIDSGKKEDGNKALKALERADEKQVGLINAIKPRSQNTVGTLDSGGRRDLSKITTDPATSSASFDPDPSSYTSVFPDFSAFQENKKKSLKDLDKLIERVIIEHMHK